LQWSANAFFPLHYTETDGGGAVRDVLMRKGVRGPGVEKSTVVREAIKSSMLWRGDHYRVRALNLSITCERMQATF